MYSIRCIGARLLEVTTNGNGHGDLGAADEPAGEEDEDAAHDDLEGGLEERRVHIAVADVADGTKLDSDNDDGDTRGQTKVRNQEGKRVAKTTGGSHQASDRATNPRGTTACEGAVVGEGLRKTHGNASAEAGGHADEEGVPTLVSGKGGGEEWSKGGNGAVLPIKITGSVQHPHYGLDLGHKADAVRENR